MALASASDGFGIQVVDADEVLTVEQHGCLFLLVLGLACRDGQMSQHKMEVPGFIIKEVYENHAKS